MQTTINIASGNGSLTVQDNGGDTVSVAITGLGQLTTDELDAAARQMLALAEARREKWITYRRALTR